MSMSTNIAPTPNVATDDAYPQVLPKHVYTVKGGNGIILYHVTVMWESGDTSLESHDKQLLSPVGSGLCVYLHTGHL